MIVTRETRLSADDEGVSIKIKATIAGRESLTDDELDKLKSSLTRELATALAHLPYTDFGIENIRLD